MLTREVLNGLSAGTLPGLLGVEVLEVEPGRVKARAAVRPDLLAPNGYLHAASIIALGRHGLRLRCDGEPAPRRHRLHHHRVEDKLPRHRADGAIACAARMVHGGRTTQIWDAEVTDEGRGRVIALFRCTQFVLYAREAAKG